MKYITVAAAVIENSQGQLLLVRKKQTQFFMQVGGKLEANEAAEDCLLREIQEEIAVAAQIKQFIGRFETAAANETDHRLCSYLYHVTLLGEPQIAAEIAAMQWFDPTTVSASDLLAPLTREVVIPWYLQYAQKRRRNLSSSSSAVF
ncbi:NUDIX hydrolase [Acinetobacter larvae]|nr:NUDIX domain-containing protein [Acinetobacter larvae]